MFVLQVYELTINLDHLGHNMGNINTIPHHSNFTNWKCIFLLFFAKCKIDANEYHKGKNNNNNSNNNIK